MDFANPSLQNERTPLVRDQMSVRTPTPFNQTSVDAVFIRVDRCARRDRISNQSRNDRLQNTLDSIWRATSPPR